MTKVRVTLRQGLTHHRGKWSESAPAISFYPDVVYAIEEEMFDDSIFVLADGSSLSEEPKEVSEAPEDDNGKEEPLPWTEDYRAAQDKAKELGIPANQSHEDLIAAIEEEL